jgi:hypothetical protein
MQSRFNSVKAVSLSFFEFGSGMSYRSAGERFEDLAFGQIVEEFVQVALDGLDSLLQQKKHQPWKSQLTLAGEILRSHSMASQEVLVAQLGAQSFDERGEIIGNVVDNRLHPQVNGGTDAKVQPKYRIISMLHLIQRQCSPALSPRSAGREREKPTVAVSRCAPRETSLPFVRAVSASARYLGPNEPVG